jgi:DNA adenine methylase
MNNNDYLKMKKSDLLLKCNELNIKYKKSNLKEDLQNLIKSHYENETNNNIALNETNNMDIVDENEDDDEYNNRIKSLSPLIKWSGGKSDEIKHFEKYIPQEYNIYLEPFIGGGSVFFHLAPEKAVIADVHNELIDLYKSIKKGYSNKIYEFMVENNNDAETYYRIRDQMEIKTSLDNAKRFYYQRKTCFRGMLRYNKDGKFNIPFGKYKTINYQDLHNKKYEQLLKRTKIIKTSFGSIFEKYNNEHNFMFLDPPYDSNFTDYGYCKFGREEPMI